MSALAAYEAGLETNASRTAQLQARVDSADEERLRLVAAKQGADERVIRLRAALAQLESQYERHVPHGELAELVGALGARLATGVPVERLSFVIEHAEAEKNCDSNTEIRELQARTPSSTALNYTETFMNGRVIVSADGASSHDFTGNALGRFDHDKPVALRFLLMNGEIDRVESKLPLAHSIVLDGSEYRFRALTAERLGYIKLVAQRCDYP